MKRLDEKRCRLSGSWFHSPVSLSHTLSRRSGAALYICLRCAAWWQRGEIGHVGVIGCSSLCPITSTWDTSWLSRLCFGRTMKGEELKEPTRRRRPLTDLTSVIGALRCQHASQIKTNGAYPGGWRLASLGPISSAPVTVHRERLIEHLTVPSRRTHTRIQIGSRARGSYYSQVVPPESLHFGS